MPRWHHKRITKVRLLISVLVVGAFVHPLISCIASLVWLWMEEEEVVV